MPIVNEATRRARPPEGRVAEQRDVLDLVAHLTGKPEQALADHLGALRPAAEDVHLPGAQRGAIGEIRDELAAALFHALVVRAAGRRVDRCLQELSEGCPRPGSRDRRRRRPGRAGRERRTQRPARSEIVGRRQTA